MRATFLALPLFASLMMTACHSDTDATTAPAAAPAKAAAAAAPVDEHSYAEPDKVAVSNLALDLSLDFDKKTLSGTATLDLD